MFFLDLLKKKKHEDFFKLFLVFMCFFVSWWASKTCFVLLVFFGEREGGRGRSINFLHPSTHVYLDCLLPSMEVVAVAASFSVTRHYQGRSSLDRGNAETHQLAMLPTLVSPSKDTWLPPLILLISLRNFGLLERLSRVGRAGGVACECSFVDGVEQWLPQLPPELWLQVLAGHEKIIWLQFGWLGWMDFKALPVHWFDGLAGVSSSCGSRWCVAR